MTGQRPSVEGSADRQPEQVADVDKTLVAELLRLSTLERLRHNDRMVETVRQLRAAFAQRGRQGEKGR